MKLILMCWAWSHIDQVGGAPCQGRKLRKEQEGNKKADRRPATGDKYSLAFK